MSVYGGFATRNQETVYNTVLFKIIFMLQSKLRFYMKVFDQEIVNKGK